MNDNQNKNSNHNNKNKKNLNGLLILVAWAVVLTVLFNYLSVYSKQAASAETTHEIQLEQCIGSSLWTGRQEKSLPYFLCCLS